MNVQAIRPALVWAIFAGVCLLAVLPWLTYAVVYSGVTLAPGAQQYLARFGTRYYAFSAFESALLLAAGIALVRLRKLALWFFVAALASYFAGMWLFQQTEARAGFGSYLNIQELVKVVFQFAAIIACIWLTRRGVLT